MTGMLENEDALSEALKDVGCDEDMRARCLALAHDGMVGSVRAQLEDYRARLVDDLHTTRESIERVDYLLHECARHVPQARR